MNSFNRYIDIPLRAIQNDLIDTASANQIKACVGFLCDEMANSEIIFESPLSGVLKSADISFCNNSSRGNKDAILKIRPPGYLAESPSWQDLVTFIRHVRDSRKTLWRQIDNLWFEFDVIDHPLACPGFFFQPKPVVNKRAPISNHEAMYELICEVLKDLSGPTFVDSLRITLKRVLNESGSDFLLFQVGFMLGRDADTIRLCFLFNDLELLPEFLRHMGLKALIPKAAQLNKVFGKLSRKFALHLDLNSDIRTKFGLELCEFGSFRGVENHGVEMLNRLVDEGICTQKRAQALMAYPGYESILNNLTEWPEALMDRFIDSMPNEMCFCVRSIGWVKLVVEPGIETKAKSYLRAKYFWKNVTSGQGDVLEAIYQFLK